MTKLFLLLVFLTTYNLQGQDSNHVEAYMGDTFFVYPYQLKVSSTYLNDNDYIIQSKYIQEEDGTVILNEKFQGKDTIEYHFYDTFDDALNTFEGEVSLYENIPPALDSLPDGKYIRYYKSLPYMDLDTLKFIRNQIASIHYLKNNIPEGNAYWFTLDKQVVYKKGNYIHGKREGIWSFSREKIVISNVYKYRKKHKNNYVSYENEKKRKPRPPKIIGTTLRTDICKISCVYANGMKNGIQIQKHSITGLYPHSSVDTTYFLNDKKSGKYCLYVNEGLFTSGAFSIDASNNEVQSGEWFFYKLKNESQQSRKNQAIKERFLSVHYVINDQKLTGKSTIIRNRFDPKPPYYGGSGGIIDGVYIVNSCGEIIQSVISNSVNVDNYFSVFYDINDEDYTYPEVGLELPFRYLVDSLGYTFKFSAYEEYYDNGQLKLKFKTINGNLEIENDTVYWENGTPMNIINYFPERKEYEQRVLDSLGIEQEASLYNANGRHLKNLHQKISEDIVIDGRSFRPSYDQTYAFGGSIPRDWYTEDRNLEDTIQLVSARYDEENEYYLERLFINPKNWNGTLYKELEPNLAFLHATIQFDSLFDSSTYKEEFTVGKLKIEYEKTDTINWGWIGEYIKPTITDTSFSPTIYRYGNFSNVNKEPVLQYNDVPYSGTLIIHLNAKEQKTRKTKNAFHIYLLEDKTHKDLVKKLVPSFKDYPRTLNKYIFSDTIKYKQATLNFYKISTLNFTFTNGVLNGESTVKNYHNQVLARTHYSNNKKVGAKTFYSHFPFTYIQSYARSFSSYSRKRIDGKEKPALFVSSKSYYENNLLEGELITYKSPVVKTYSTHYHLGLKNGESTEYFDDEDNSIKWRSNYINDKREGSSFSYDLEGEFLYKRNYHNGFKDGIQLEYDSKGYLSSELNYKRDTLNGLSRNLYWNGTIFQKGFYENGYLKDTLFIYDTDEVLKTTLIYNQRCFVSGQNYENGLLKNSFENSINKFKHGISSKEDSSNLYVGYRSNFNKHEFRGSLTREDFYYLIVKDSVYYTEYDMYGTIQKEGEDYDGKKIGLWKYNFPYLGKYTIYYSDSIVTINDSSQIKSIGLFIQKDENGILISKKHILNEIPLYNCGQKETYEISTYYTIYENDTSQHLLNGFITYLYSNGVKQSEGRNKNGLPTGIWKYYNDNGSLRETGRYKNGKKEGRWLSGDLSKIAYLGDLCLDMDKPINQEIIKNLENKLEILETFFKSGIIQSQYFFYLE